ncbi:hypothetical protein [Corallococcus aberystwythensis]|uniref:Uncharacterized protein n=1 Tax=Corallococcus aberystwythensis TaxID=2316722 RepID=A0A3A8PPA8_9BACT|nr:hypothetical protein [Corallococcus aberystwythensis]RKH58236.1 hypothetical protein D7W81_29530 [Corallococcus aberystwythensis]
MASINTFTSTNCGASIGTATGGPMLPGSALVSINGSTDLSQCIKGDGGSYVQKISIESYEGDVYTAKIVVTGCGPSGMGHRSDFTFTMSSGEAVTLSIASTSLEDHTVKCRTTGLVQIGWNLKDQ